MHILAIGLTYKTAPVEIRERLTFQEEQIADGMLELKNRKSILENVIISTCNRTEIYAVVDQLHTGKYYIKEFLADWFSISREEFESHLFYYEGDEAVRHLFEVTCGLDSMVLGETQILGQVRTSYFLAQDIKTIGTVFQRLFKQAITVAKKAHTETEIASNAVSISYAAVELGKKIFGSLVGKNVLIIGAGKMGELAIQNLIGSGANNITVLNRTYENGKVLANKYNGKAYPLTDLESCLADADIVITSTGSANYIITKAMAEKVEKTRKGRPIFFVDIAVPRNIDPEISQFSSIFLYDIDDLEGIVEANLLERQKAAELIHAFIEDERVEFSQWLLTLGVIPLIASLREKALNIQSETMKSLERKLPHLSEREKKVISKHTKSMINQMLKDPILQIKEMAAEPNAEIALQFFRQIFNLENNEKEAAEKEESVNTAEMAARTTTVTAR